MKGKEWAPGQTLGLVFNEILIETLQQHFNIKQDELPEEFAHKRIEQDGGLIEQRSSLYTFDKSPAIRVGAFNAENFVYVRNATIWPGDDYDYPVLVYDSAETTRWLFMLLDLHPLRKDKFYRKQYVEPMAAIKEKYKNIPKVKGARTKMREWTEQYTSGHAFYLRCPKEYEGRVEQGFREYLDFYIKKVKVAVPIVDLQLRTDVLAFKKEFKNIYAENDPGGGPYKTFFGKEWTERFLHEFLFA
jgi:15,16-dihydrobiliverdin:ferredoxin oxidoreductase